MNKYLNTALYWFLIALMLIAIWIWTSGCALSSPIIKSESFPICLKITITDLSEIEEKYGATGMAFLMRSNESEILVSGHYYQGKLVFDRPATLGHEIIHILNWEYPELIADPDSDNY